MIMNIFPLIIAIFSLVLTQVYASSEIQDMPSFHSIVIFAPHPDDETLFAGGVIEAAVQNHIPVKIVVVTNGDILGQKYGNYRENETVRAMKHFGLAEDDVIFLGYADQLTTTLLKAKDPLEVFQSKARRHSTYAHRGLCQKSYHECWDNSEGLYNHQSIAMDIAHVLKTYRPDAIFTTSRFDKHPDHSGVQAFVQKEIIDLAAVDNSFHPTMYEAIVHAPGQMLWPYFDSDKIHMPKFFKPDPEIWNDKFIRFRVLDRKLKLHAINKYLSQMYTPWLRDYAKTYEPFEAFSF
jgi:LmbE family N-acetylglucosaminyl deacetylase